VSLRRSCRFGCRACSIRVPLGGLPRQPPGSAVVLPRSCPTDRQRGLLQAMTATLAVLVVRARSHSQVAASRADGGSACPLVAASLWPGSAHLEPGVPGALLFILVTYGIGRLQRPVASDAGSGAARGRGDHGANRDLGSRSEALLAGPRSTRCTMACWSSRRDRPGLFKPNTSAGYEAMTVVLAAAVGLPLGWGKAWRLTSGSAVLLGAAPCAWRARLRLEPGVHARDLAAMAMLVVVPGRAFWERARSLLPYGSRQP